MIGTAPSLGASELFRSFKQLLVFTEEGLQEGGELVESVAASGDEAGGQEDVQEPEILFT